MPLQLNSSDEDKKQNVNGLMMDRPLSEIEKEIKEANLCLLEWAKGLEKYNAKESSFKK